MFNLILLILFCVIGTGLFLPIPYNYDFKTKQLIYTQEMGISKIAKTIKFRLQKKIQEKKKNVEILE